MRRFWLPLLAIALLTGCVGLPSSGSVQEGLERAPEPEGIVFLAPDPQPGGDPARIVEGFLDAATAGVADRFETAQKYLTDNARQAWEPGAGVTIYAGSTPPVVKERLPGRVTVTVTVAGVVDESGVYNESVPGTQQTFHFRLTEVDDQWRIADLDDGVLISVVNFGTQYRHVPLAFFSPDGQYLIPDPRWFPERNPASSAVSALLQGPVEWISAGVARGFPAGTQADPVNVLDGTAEVRLSEEALLALPSERALAVAELEYTLLQLPQVRRVRISVDGVPYIDGDHGLNPIVDPSVGHNPVVLTDSFVATLAGSAVIPVEGITLPQEHKYNALAVPYGGLAEAELPLVVRAGRSRLVALNWGEEEPEVLIEGDRLLPPSYDPHGWVWTGEQRNNGTLVVTKPGSGVVSVVASPGLADHNVSSLKVSRDGLRVAVVQRQEDDVRVYLGMIHRDADGTPASISADKEIGFSVKEATDVVWLDHTTVAVLGSSEDDVRAVHTVPISGPSVALLSVPGATSIASGWGEREIWVLTVEGQLYNRAGNGWRKFSEIGSALAVAFPG